MAVSLIGFNEVSDLCIGKPPVRTLPPSATVADALLALKTSSVDGDWIGIRSAPSSGKRVVVGKVCMVDILCYLCDEDNVGSPAAALASPVSAILSKGAGPVRIVERSSSLLEALDVILDGAMSLAVPIRSATPRRKLAVGATSSLDFCWVTQEDFVRFFLNFIALFSPAPALSVSDLGLVRPATLVVRPHDPAISALPLIRSALEDQTSVAVVTDDGRLIGEISPSTLAHCDERAAAAIAALSAADLMAYVDCFGSPPDCSVRSVKARLKDKGLNGMIELLETDLISPPFSSSSTSSSSSSSDEESWPASSTGRRLRKLRSAGRSGSYSARMGRRSEEAIVCHPESSLVAVMIQGLAHRVNYVWVVDKDYLLVGIVGFTDILEVLRNQLDA